MLMYYVKQSLWLILVVGGPLVLFTMFVGLLLGFCQAIFQLQDQAFPFGVKLVGSVMILILLGPWMSEQVMVFTNNILDVMASI